MTDTDKWKKRWYQQLGSKLRDLRQFILDDCDMVGIWEVNLERASFHIGSQITLDDIKNSFPDDLTFLDDDSIFIKSFIYFQYGVLINTNNAHRGYLKRLKEKGISLPDQPLTSPWAAPLEREREREQEMDMDKEKEKDKEKDKEKENRKKRKELFNQNCTEMRIFR